MNLQLLPMTAEAAAQLVNAENGEVAKIKYLAGFPRSYRFDASRGYFNVGGIQPISKKDEPITIIPVAYRIFTADILGVKGKKWVEIFFLNQSNHLCNILFHGYSVDSLLENTQELFYDDVNLCGVALTIQPIEKTSKQQDDNGKHPKYYIGKFTYQLLDEVARENLKTTVETHQIWRADTVTTEVETQVAVNYQVPTVVQEIAGTTEESSVIAKENEVSTTTPKTSTSTPKKSKRGKRKEVVVG